MFNSVMDALFWIFAVGCVWKMIEGFKLYLKRMHLVKERQCKLFYYEHRYRIDKVIHFLEWSLQNHRAHNQQEQDAIQSIGKGLLRAVYTADIKPLEQIAPIIDAMIIIFNKRGPTYGLHRPFSRTFATRRGGTRC